MIIDATVLLTGEQSKKTVFSTIINHFSTALPYIDPQSLFEQFWQRELLGSTGIGHGVAIPHVRSELVEKTHAVFIRLEHPVDFTGVDKQPVDIVMGMLFSGHNQEHNLKELKQVAEFFNSSNNRQFIRDAEQEVTIEYILRSLATEQSKTEAEYC